MHEHLVRYKVEIRLLWICCIIYEPALKAIKASLGQSPMNLSGLKSCGFSQ
jgi:hypothetical protein